MTPQGYVVILVLAVLGILALIQRNQREEEWIDESARKSQNRFEYMNAPIIEASEARRAKEEKDRREAERLERYRKNQEDKPTAYEAWLKETHPEYESITGRWSPTGWYFNNKTGKWEPPDYLNEESSRKWRWDEEKQIWVDTDKERRLERYRKNREGKPPTYEEWKAAKLAKQKSEDETATCTNDN